MNAPEPSQLDDPKNPWRSIDRAPKDATWMEVKIEKTQKVHRAHWAQGGGEDQPYFIGWFEAVRQSDGKVSYYSEIPEPYAWRPIGL